MGGIYAIRSVRVPSQLSDLQAEVNAAAAHGGGWVQIILYRVCSQTYDPGNYTSCLNSNRPVQLDTVNGFLDWLQNAGQPGGAPAGATTVNFLSVDNAGNAEQVRSQLVQVGANADPVVVAAGDIGCDPADLAFNGDGTATSCRAKGTSGLLAGADADAVLPLGDNPYDCGGSSAFAQSHDPSWGQFKSITHPVPGDKDYATSGGTDCPSTPGAGYYAYFGSRAGDPSKGYYSYDLGSWHVIALNTAPCPTDGSFCAACSAQEQWLQSDLAASSSACTLAYFQNPRFASRSSGGSTTYAPFWNDLYARGVDVVLNGDAHWYERFQPMDPSGAADPTFGVREFTVETGGAGLESPSTPLATSQAAEQQHPRRAQAHAARWKLRLDVRARHGRDVQ
jgi:hypothetical protein